ncbi:MAG TPA: hypothetical protein VKS82_04415 [Streptosporangiaceae bacterium]|nr:hypothetical protein [Streptosporangiaceae bacterium]
MGRLVRTVLAAAMVMTVAAGFAPASVADHVLVSFGGPNGAGPLSGVSAGPGGGPGCGTVYTIKP